MENKTPDLKHKKALRVTLIALASIILVGVIGYGTVTILRTVKAPTLSGAKQPQSSPTVQQPPVTPEKAQVIADAAYETGSKKAADGDQKAALTEYKTAYKNYKIANNEARADDAEFAIKSIEAVLAVPENPVKTNATTSAKQ